MDNFRARPALDPPASEAVALRAQHFDDASGQPDDPLGDEAAFPSTWQSLAGLETSTAE